MSTITLRTINEEQLKNLNEGKTVYIQDGRSGFELRLEKEYIKDTFDIKAILKVCKANKYTYINLDNNQIDYFKKQYYFLKSNIHKITYFPWKKERLKTFLKGCDGSYINKLSLITYINTL